MILNKLGNYKKGDAKSCHNTYLKNSNPMGFLIMLSKLLPALECPHTILTTGPVKKRLVTKKAKLLLLNFLASMIVLCDDIDDIVSSYDFVCEDCANAEETGRHCTICGDDGLENPAALIAHICGPGHLKHVVEKLKKENNIKSLQNFGYNVNRPQTSASTTSMKKKKINQLREGLRNMSTNEKEQLTSTRKTAFLDASVVKDSNVDIADDDLGTKASKIDVGPGHVTKRSQECRSTPPVTSSSQEAAATDGATAGTDQGGSRRRICWNCHAQGTLLKCSGCMRALYCDQQCQEADWARHGGYCQARMRKRRLAEVD